MTTISHQDDAAAVSSRPTGARKATFRADRSVPALRQRVALLEERVTTRENAVRKRTDAIIAWAETLGFKRLERLGHSALEQAPPIALNQSPRKQLLALEKALIEMGKQLDLLEKKILSVEQYAATKGNKRLEAALPNTDSMPSSVRPIK